MTEQENDSRKESDDMNKILRTENLCKYYGSGENEVRAVQNANIDIQKGEFVAIVGKSGSGKSTLLHMLGGLDTPTGGKVFIRGKDIFSYKEDALAVFRRRKIGFIFQSFNLVSSINVWENIVLPIGLDGRKADEAFVMDIVKTLGLEKKLHNLPNTLSGGQQQRVAIARALASRPDILFADEPTGNLDSHTSEEVMRLMRRVVQNQGKTLVMVTHDDHLAEYADRVFHIIDGKIVKIDVNTSEKNEKGKKI